MNETALFFKTIVSGLNDLTVVGLLGLVALLVFAGLKMGIIKPEWFVIKTKRDEKIDKILLTLDNIKTNDFQHVAQIDDINRMNAILEKISTTLESALITMNTQAELTRQVVYSQKDICNKYDAHDKQARDILNVCTNIWEHKCKTA